MTRAASFALMLGVMLATTSCGDKGALLIVSLSSTNSLTVTSVGLDITAGSTTRHHDVAVTTLPIDIGVQLPTSALGSISIVATAGGLTATGSVTVTAGTVAHLSLTFGAVVANDLSTPSDLASADLSGVALDASIGDESFVGDSATSADATFVPDATTPPDLVPDPRDFAPDPCEVGALPSDTPDNVAKCVIGSPPTIDGKLTDWASATFYPLNHANAALTSNDFTGTPNTDNADISGLFAMRWDMDYLYFAVQVTDDVRAVYPSNPGSDYQDDAVEIYLDGNNQREQNYTADDHQFIVTADGRGLDWQYPTSGVAIDASVLFAVSDTSPTANWSFEVAIPWSQLGSGTVQRGRLLGVDFGLDDDDNTTTQTRKHNLVRYANTPTNPNCLLGSSLVPSLPACDTGMFGLLMLGGR